MKRLLKLFKGELGQISAAAIVTIAIAAIGILLLVPAIDLSLESGDWSTIGAKEYLERMGYTVVVPTAGITTGDLLPNTDSTWDIGASGNEFAEGHTDDTILGGSLLGVTAMQDTFMDVLAVTANYVVAAEDLSAGIPLTFTLAAQPDVPRTISVDFVAHLQITAYTIVITGVDTQGNALVETFTEAADPWNFETDGAFATVTSIIMTARTGTGAGDTANAGITDVLGLSNNINATGDVYKIVKNAVDQTVAVAQVSILYNTYDMSVIGLAATDDFTIWYNGNISHTD